MDASLPLRKRGSITKEQADALGVFAYACTISGTILCFLVLLAHGAATPSPKGRPHLDRGSLRLLCYSLFFKLVLVNGVNGKAMEKYYVIVVTLLSIVLTVPAFGLNRLGWEEANFICWLKSPDEHTKVQWLISTQPFWIVPAATIETICSVTMLFWMAKLQAIQQAEALDAEFLLHVTLEDAPTASTHESTASDILADMVHVTEANILVKLKNLYEPIIGNIEVLDYAPQTEAGRKYLRDIVNFLQTDNALNFTERIEANITAGHRCRLQMAVNIVRGILADKIPDLKQLFKLLTHNDMPLERGGLKVSPDQTVHLRVLSEPAAEDIILMAAEDKVSKGMGTTVNLAKKFGLTVHLTDPDATSKVIRQIYTQVELSHGNIGLLTSLKNGTWLYYCKDKSLYTTENLTPEGSNDIERLETLLTAEVLSILFALHQHKMLPEATFGPFIDILPSSHTSWLCKRISSLARNIILFSWFWLSLLFLQITGPFLLRTNWVDHSSLCKLPLLLKMGEELGRGAHGVVKRIQGLDLAVKIGGEDIIGREASFYLQARQHQNLPMLADFGVFRMEGSDGCALLLELAKPNDGTNPDTSEIEESLESLRAQLEIHYHDVCIENTVRGLKDDKLKIIDFALATSSRDCPQCHNLPQDDPS
ncbi:hypothetical protein EYR38_002034 [Pleurotus pulmonarius]|nr:hypothetical protein EYR38_002034 [Pleurotus pulmonarius]